MTLLLVCALTAPARAGDCARGVDGSVTCTGSGFDLLVKEALSARGEAKACAIKLDECAAKVEYREHGLAACEAALAAVPPAPPPRSLVRPLSGYGVGVVSSVLLISGIVAPLPEAARILLGGAGLIGLAGGAVLVIW